MRQVLIYFVILLDAGLFIFIDVLELAYGLTSKDDISVETFEVYKTSLVPMRDNYLILTFATNTLLVGVLIARYARNRARGGLATIEKIGLVINICTTLTLGFLKLFVPTGPFF